MKRLLYFCALLLLLGLAGCEEKSASPTTQQQQVQTPVNTAAMQAIETLKARVAINPNDFEALSTLGDLYFESQQYIDAFNTYDKAIAVNPNCADCFNDRGLSLYYLGDVASALESFDKAISIDPGYKHAWLSKGYVLTAQGRYSEAVAPLNKVKELDGTGPLAVQADKFLAAGVQNQP